MSDKIALEKELYTTYVTVERVNTTINGRTSIEFDGVGARFWVANGTRLKVGDRVRLTFHKETFNQEIVSDA